MLNTDGNTGPGTGAWAMKTSKRKSGQSDEGVARLHQKANGYARRLIGKPSSWTYSEARNRRERPAHG